MISTCTIEKKFKTLNDKRNILIFLQGCNIFEEKRYELKKELYELDNA